MVNVVLLTCLLFASPTMDKKVAKAHNYFSHPKDVRSNPALRIIGGREVTPHKYPFQVALRIYNGKKYNSCGGTLYSNRFVLTAAHCLEQYPNYIEVLLGAHDITKPDSIELILKTTTYIIHEYYDVRSARNDIALVQLPKSVNFTNRIQTVRIANGSKTYEGEIGRILGWGKTEHENSSAVLREVRGTIITNQKCGARYRRLIRLTNVCAFGEPIIGGCQADSGGPLLVKRVQVGIASYTSPNCSKPNWPTTFTRLTEYREWIERNTDGANILERIPFAVTVAVALCLVRFFK